MTTRLFDRWAIPGALFFAVLSVGFLVSIGCRERFNAAFRKGGNVFLSRVTFGRGGRAILGPWGADLSSGDGSPRVQQNVAADSVLRLRVDGYTGELALGLNLHKDAFLPLLLFAAIVLAAPVNLKLRIRRVFFGAPVVLAAALGNVWFLASYTFAFRMRGVYLLGSAESFLFDLSYRALLLPPGNRFIAALVIGLGLVVRPALAQSRRFTASGVSRRLVVDPAPSPSTFRSAREARDTDRGQSKG